MEDISKLVMSETAANTMLERWIKAEMRADRLQQQLDILRERRFADPSSAQLAEARRHIIALRGAIALHRRTIDSPSSPALAGIVDRALWAVLDAVPAPAEEDLLDE